MIARALVTLGLLGASACAVEPAAPALGQVSQEVAVCADGPTVYGIDVSRFQGAIDWQAVKQAEVVFAFIQISRSLTDLDLKFDYNWRRAKEVGIVRGAYQRFQPDQDVVGQANVFLDALGPYQPGDLPPMLDVEDDGGLAPSVIAQRVRQWIDLVEPVVGVKPIIYTGYYFWRDAVGDADFSDHPLWIANYSATCPLVPDSWDTWTFHQYSASARIPGITANTVDVNWFNGTRAQLAALASAEFCGDDTCSTTETTASCPTDCPAGSPDTMLDGFDAGASQPVESAGCAAGGGGGGGALVVLLAGGWTRRRRFTSGGSRCMRL